MFKIEYFNGEEWIPAGGPFASEEMAWISLGDDKDGYRVVNEEKKSQMSTLNSLEAEN